MAGRKTATGFPIDSPRASPLKTMEMLPVGRGTRVGDHLMRRYILLLGFLCSFSLAAAAQGPQGVGSDSYGETAIRAGVGAEPTAPLASPWRFAVGYQYNRIDLSGTPFTTVGANISASRLFTNWLGAEAQAGFGFGNSGGTTVPSNLTVKTTLVAAGPRLVLPRPWPADRSLGPRSCRHGAFPF